MGFNRAAATTADVSVYFVRKTQMANLGQRPKGDTPLATAVACLVDFARNSRRATPVFELEGHDARAEDVKGVYVDGDKIHYRQIAEYMQGGQSSLTAEDRQHVQRVFPQFLNPEFLQEALSRPHAGGPPPVRSGHAASPEFYPDPVQEVG